MEVSENDFKAVLKDKKILIAEDDDMVQFYISEIFEPYKANIDFADNGFEAVKMYSEKNQKYDIILMDIRMPIMGGYEATEAILKINPNAIIIAQTAHESSYEKDKCLNAGFTEYLSKPLSKELLFETINRHLN